MGAAEIQSSKFFRYARGLSIGLIATGIVLAIALALTSNDANAGLPILFFGGVYVAFGVPVCMGITVLAALSLVKGENHRSGAIAMLLVMGGLAWFFRAVPIRFAQALAETISTR